MALNSYVTKDGGEMGRAQVAQAEASGLEPEVDMNPVLLKPTGDSRSQVIIQGKPLGNMSAREYHRGYSLKAFQAVMDSLDRLCKVYDTLVIEGAGSPAEINLKDHDIVNMRVAKYLKAPVLLVADIDRGGSLAALVGTLALLDEDERDLVKGLIINKFRGDVSLFTPAITFLEEKTHKPVLGVIPYIENLGIDDEDSVSLEETRLQAENADISIAVISLPRISNFTDFDSLAGEIDTDVYYVSSCQELGHPDAIILPGSKNTTEDLQWLKKTGLYRDIMTLHASGIPVIGICGGYQMLGQSISDPYHAEAGCVDIEGFGLLPTSTVFSQEKDTYQVIGHIQNLTFLGHTFSYSHIKGYEIHMGQTHCDEKASRPFIVQSRSGRPCHVEAGCANDDGTVFATYIHGIFDNDEFRAFFVNALRQKKGLPPLEKRYSFIQERQRRYDRLARIVAAHMDIPRLRRIMDGVE
jgi:adenosylcobyric acid synthase